MYTQEKLEKLRKIEMEMMGELDRLCRAHGLTYAAAYGTLLGAIRHNGFIPWDDDMDFIMPREDYERFLKIAETELGESFLLSHYSVEPEVPYYFAKLRKRGTCFLEEGMEQLPIHHGVSIDIFPVDNAPASPLGRRLLKLRADFRRELCIARGVSVLTMKPASRVTAFFAGAVRKCTHLLACLFSRERLFFGMNRLLTRFNGRETGWCTACGYDFIEKEVLFPVKEHVFEDGTVLIPADPDRLLTVYYGDYMTLPPLEKQVNHAPAVLILEGAEK